MVASFFFKSMSKRKEKLSTSTVRFVEIMVYSHPIVSQHIIIKGVPSYGAVILLLRNPYSALVAEWNRKKSSTSRDTSERKKTSVHTRTVAPENFGIAIHQDNNIQIHMNILL